MFALCYMLVFLSVSLFYLSFCERFFYLAELLDGCYFAVAEMVLCTCVLLFFLSLIHAFDIDSITGSMC